jgi:hypothetical protein
MAAPRRTPQKRLSPQIYRRRRIVAIAAIVLVGWAIIALVSAIVGAIGSAFSGPTPSTAPTNVEGQACAPGDIMATAVVGREDGTEAESFATGEQPYIWFTIKNVGSVTCTFNAGPAVQFYTIRSGNDLIWTSRNCERAGLLDQLQSIEPGESLPPSPPSPWERVRSSSTGCNAETQVPVTAGAYNLTVEVNGVLSDGNQFLLN